MSNFVVRLKKPHLRQQEILNLITLATAKRFIIRAGRRFGKTTLAAILAVQTFLAGRRVLYAAPTIEQLDRFWTEIKIALAELIAAGVFYKSETEHVIELRGTNQRISAKTAWNADSLRGDFADLLILDEWQLANESTWEEVGAPMLLDNNGDALFIYTPPSLHSRSATKARDPRHASKMFAKAQADTTGLWAAFHFSSHENPYISAEGLRKITTDMTSMAYRQEIMAEDIDEVPGALWTMKMIDQGRTSKDRLPELTRIIVAIDPSTTCKEGSDEAGIIVAGLGADRHGYVLEDVSHKDSPNGWASTAIKAYYRHQADVIIAEVNNGGDMVKQIIEGIDPDVFYDYVRASRGKLTRAEPICAYYERRMVHHVGVFEKLEDEMVTYVPGRPSPNRLDAMVWALTELMIETDLELVSIW